MKNIKQYIKKTSKSGFSLIEMLFVIAVIGVISAIAIPNIGKMNQFQREEIERRNTEVSRIAMGAWNTAVIHGDIEMGSGHDLAQIITLVSGDPGKFGISPEESEDLKNAHPEQFKNLSVDVATGLLVFARPVKLGEVTPGQTSQPTKRD